MADALKTARRVFAVEAQAVSDLADRLTHDFSRAVELIVSTSGKIITTGIGKSGLIANKITATFNSIGIYSTFLHPVEALHGDLGVARAGDVLLALSNSGYSDELLALMPIIKQRGVTIVAMTGGLDSPLAKASDILLDCGIAAEACTLNLVPTASTTAALAMGDALAVASMEMRNFAAEDFQRSHPGGNLGQRLALQVKQVMLIAERLPLVEPRATVRQAIAVMDAKDLGTVLVSSPENKLLGIFTDGDLRRLTLNPDTSWCEKPIAQLMTTNPRTISPDMLAADALHIMEKMQITVLAITDEQGRIMGIVHLHDLLGRGKISFSYRNE